MNKFTTKNALLSALVGLGGVAYFIYPPLLLFFPTFLAFVGVCWGWGCFAIAGGVSMGIILALSGGAVANTAAAVALYLPVSFLLAYCFVERKPYRIVVSVSSAYFVIALYCALCLPSLLSGGGPFDQLEVYIRETSAYFEDSMLAAGAQQESIDMLTSFRSAMILLLPEISVIALFSTGMLAGFADTLQARALCVSKGVKLRPMAPFYLWQLSKNFNYGMTIFLVGGIIAYLANINNATAVLCAVECLVGWPLVLIGASVIAFFVKIRPYRNGAMTTMFFISFALFMPYSIYFLGLLGLIDRAFRLRKKILDRTR